MRSVLSPCLTCTRVIDPEECTDKSCRVWQAWFLRQWEESRMQLRQMKELPEKRLGVVVGGHRYAAPHQIRAYLRKDPCGDCLCPVGLCKTPCRKRRVWEDCVGEEG